MTTRKRHAVTAALVLGLVGAAGAASAQALFQRDNAAWLELGWAGGAKYSVLPASIVRDGKTVRFTMKADIPPSPDGASISTVVAEALVDCETPAIGTGTTDFYNATAFMRTVQEGSAPVPVPASDPGQTLLIDHVCKS